MPTMISGKIRKKEAACRHEKTLKRMSSSLFVL